VDWARASRAVWAVRLSSTQLSTESPCRYPALTPDGKTVVCAVESAEKHGPRNTQRWLAYAPSGPATPRVLATYQFAFPSVIRSASGNGLPMGIYWISGAGDRLIVSTGIVVAGLPPLGVVSGGEFTPLPFLPPGTPSGQGW
jgi:hypothetical protein